MAAYVAREWTTAYEMLAPERRATLQAFIDGSEEHLDSRGDRFEASEPIHDPDQIRRWVVPDNYPINPILPATADYDRAFLTEVQFLRLPRVNSSWQVYMLAPDALGTWYVWQFR